MFAVAALVNWYSTVEHVPAPTAAVPMMVSSAAALAVMVAITPVPAMLYRIYYPTPTVSPSVVFRYV